MVNKPKRKGTAAETAVVSFLRLQGFPYAERLALQGGKDRGDITGIPGIVIEVKAENEYTWSGWLKETKVEQGNAKADFGLLVSKPRTVGATRVGNWYAGMYAADFGRLFHAAGEDAQNLWIHHMSGHDINRQLGPAMFHLPGFMKSAQVGYGVIEISPKGVKDQDLWYTVMSLSQACSLLVSAGYGRTT